tara:strand:+ start:306 stop:425 length:120 start_codon:yes stop_codon:yes gene_type:complete
MPAQTRVSAMERYQIERCFNGKKVFLRKKIMINYLKTVT